MFTQKCCAKDHQNSLTLSEGSFDMIEHGPIGLCHLNILTHVRLSENSEFGELLSRQSHGVNSIWRRLAVNISKRVLSGSVLFGLLGSLWNGMVSHVDSCLSRPSRVASFLQYMVLLKNAINTEILIRLHLDS